MYTVKNDYEEEINIKNSRFITVIKKVNDINEVNSILEEVKTKYPKATHYPYAYIIGDNKRSSDDGEPSSTAGIPILNVLEKENITNVIVIVIRYFGGIKLGTGGLVRAYTKLLKTYIKKEDLISLIPGKRIILSFTYEDQNKVNYLLKDINILNKSFNELIEYELLISNDDISILNNYTYKVMEDLYIEKSL